MLCVLSLIQGPWLVNHWLSYWDILSAMRSRTAKVIKSITWTLQSFQGPQNKVTNLFVAVLYSVGIEEARGGSKYSSKKLNHTKSILTPVVLKCWYGRTYVECHLCMGRTAVYLTKQRQGIILLAVESLGALVARVGGEWDEEAVEHDQGFWAPASRSCSCSSSLWLLLETSLASTRPLTSAELATITTSNAI